MYMYSILVPILLVGPSRADLHVKFSDPFRVCPPRSRSRGHRGSEYLPYPVEDYRMRTALACVFPICVTILVELA